MFGGMCSCRLVVIVLVLLISRALSAAEARYNKFLNSTDDLETLTSVATQNPTPRRQPTQAPTPVGKVRVDPATTNPTPKPRKTKAPTAAQTNDKTEAPAEAPTPRQQQSPSPTYAYPSQKPTPTTSPTNVTGSWVAQATVTPTFPASRPATVQDTFVPNAEPTRASNTPTARPWQPSSPAPTVIPSRTPTGPIHAARTPDPTNVPVSLNTTHTDAPTTVTLKPTEPLSVQDTGAPSTEPSRATNTWKPLLEPTQAPKAPIAPSRQTPSPSAYPCGCSTCTVAIWNNDADGYSCGDRIVFLMQQQVSRSSLSLKAAEEGACIRVAGDEFPSECGPFCDPRYCDGRSSAVAWNQWLFIALLVSVNLAVLLQPWF